MDLLLSAVIYILYRINSVYCFILNPISFPVTDEMLQPIMENMTIEEAIQNKKLYIIDYTFLRDLQCTDDREVW